jgi:hypothetical protein
MIFTMLDRIQENGRSLRFTLPGFKTARVEALVHNVTAFDLLVQGRQIVRPLNIFQTVGQAAARPLGTEEDTDEDELGWADLWIINYTMWRDLGRHSTLIPVHSLIRCQVENLQLKDQTGYLTVELSPA